MMQTVTFYQPPLQTGKQNVQMSDGARASVTHLLAGAFSTPCSTAAHTFVQTVPPLSRFQLALDVLMPMLDAPVEVSRYSRTSTTSQSDSARAPPAANATNSGVLYTVLIIRTPSHCD